MHQLYNAIDGMRDYIVSIQSELVSIPALGPDNEGVGEQEKADYLKKHLKELGVKDIREFKAPDDRIPCGYRPNLAAVVPGKNTDRTLWVIAHIDVVPPGDRSLWDSDPYSLVKDGDRIIGRGVEDNHQGLVSALCVAKGLLETDIIPEVSLGLLFVADEETGSKYGLGYVVEEHGSIFSKEDLFLVPDFGQPTSDFLEIAEKSMFWLKVVVEGKQCHASTPEQGNNSLVACSDLILRVRRLYDKYDATDDLFDPPFSTFEPTKKEANVENINTIPGRDVFYVDARVLACYDLDEILETIRGYCREVEAEYGVTVSDEVVQQEQAAPATPLESEIVQRVMDGVKRIYGKQGKPAGVGGGTVAAFLRRNGFDAVVWSTLNHQAHQPNEWASLSATIGDAKVMAHILMA